jgi:hypothetical protein
MAEQRVHLIRSKLEAADAGRRYQYSGTQLSIFGFELPNLAISTAIDSNAPELNVRMARSCPPLEKIVWIHDWSSDPKKATTTMSLGRLGDRAVLSFPDAADFILSPCATSIEIAPTPEASDVTVEHLLLDQVLPRVLAWKGRLVLHGGAVMVGSEAIMFLGDTGRGKSTLTAKLASQGLQLLSDDGVVVEHSATRVCVRATYPSLRLLPDSIAHVCDTEQRYSPVAEYTDKQRIFLPPTDANTAPQPLLRLFFLSDDVEVSATEVIIRRLSAREVCLGILANSFELDPTDGTAASRRLDQAAKIANLVPGYSLSFPRSFGRLTEVCTFVLNTSE